MLKPIGFAAFLKLLELSDAQRRAEIKKKLKGGGGYQYWRPLQNFAPKALVPDADISFLKSELASRCKGHQQKYNKNAFAAFCKWIEGKDLALSAQLPPIDVPFGNSGLTVRLRPEVSFESNGKLFAASLWATTRPLLSNATKSIGLQFCSLAYKAKGFEAHEHLIFDTIVGSPFTEKDILSSSLHLLKDKVDRCKIDLDTLNVPTPEAPSSPSDQPPIQKAP